MTGDNRDENCSERSDQARSGAVPITRRTVVGGGLVGLAALGAASPSVGQSASDAATSVQMATRQEVIDFRIRPPFRSMRAIFGSSIDAEQAAGKALSDDQLMAEFIEKMDRAGIDRAVVMGRTVPQGDWKAMIPNEDVEALVKQHPKRFVGFGSVDVRDPKLAIAEVDRCAGMGLRGIAFDNPASTPALYDDDQSLMPIYERCARNKLIISIASSVLLGPDISYAMPSHIQRVGLAFPQTPIVVPHAAYPWTTQMTSIVWAGSITKKSIIYMIPDAYWTKNMPGRQDYIDAANLGLDKRILFASSYPGLQPEAAIAEVRAMPFAKPESLARILGGNAQTLLEAYK